LTKGSIVIAWNKPIAITNYKNIENTDSIKDLIGVTAQPQNEKDIGEYLLFIDGSVINMEENLDALYKKIGFCATFAGGGAGEIPTEASPCIITNEGLLENTMQTIATNHKSQTTITHGWEKQSGPHLVTASKKTKIKSLDYESIISFYKRHNTKFGNHRADHTKFSSFFQSYLVGIEKLDGEVLIRDPFKHSEKSINYIGNIPEYSQVQILGGTKDSSRGKVDQELTDLNLKEEKNIDATFIFNCVDRDDADHNGFSKELKMLNKHLPGSKHIIGAQTIGEIATSESRLLHLHSKTIVISRLVHLVRYLKLKNSLKFFKKPIFRANDSRILFSFFCIPQRYTCFHRLGI